MKREQNAKKFLARHPNSRKRQSDDNQRSKRNLMKKRRNSKGTDAKVLSGTQHRSRGRSRGRGSNGGKVEKTVKVKRKSTRRISQGSEKESSASKKGYINNYMKQVQDNIRKSNRSTRRKSNTKNADKSVKSKKDKSGKNSRANSKSAQPKKNGKSRRQEKTNSKGRKPKLPVTPKVKRGLTKKPSMEQIRKQKMRPSVINKNGLSCISEKTVERNTNLDSREGLFQPGSQIHVMNSFTPPIQSGQGVNFIEQNTRRLGKVSSSTNNLTVKKSIRQVFGMSMALKKSQKMWNKTWSSRPNKPGSINEGGGNPKTIDLNTLTIQINKNFDKSENSKAMKRFLNMCRNVFDKEKSNSKNGQFGSEFRNREQNFSTKTNGDSKKTESMFQVQKSLNNLRKSGQNDFKSISSISKKNKIIPGTNKKGSMIMKIDEKPQEEDDTLDKSQKNIQRSSQKIFHIKKDEPVKLISQSESKSNIKAAPVKPLRITNEPLIPKKVGSFINSVKEGSKNSTAPKIMGSLISKKSKTISGNTMQFEESKTLSELGSMPIRVINEDASFNLTNNTGITPGISILKKEISPDLKQAIEGDWAGGSSRIVEQPENEGPMENAAAKKDIDSEVWMLQNPQGKQDMDQLLRNNNMKIQGINFSGNPSQVKENRFDNLNISSDNIREVIENLPDSSQRNIGTNDESGMNLTDILQTKPETFQKTEQFDNTLHGDKTTNFDNTLGGLLSQGNRTVLKTQDPQELKNLLSELTSKSRNNNNFQFSKQLDELQREVIKMKINEHNMTVTSGQIIPEVQSSQATGGTNNNTSKKTSKSGIFDVEEFKTAGRQSDIQEYSETFDDNDLPFKKKNQKGVLVESSLPQIHVTKEISNRNIHSNPNHTGYQNSHLLDQTDNFQHSANMITYNLGSMTLNRTDALNQTAGSRREHANTMESGNIDMILDDVTGGGHSKAIQRNKTVEEKREEAKQEIIIDALEQKIGGGLDSQDLQNLVKQNAQEMGDLKLDSMNLGAFDTNSKGNFLRHLQSNQSGVIGDFDDDNKVNMTMNMTMNMTQMSGIHGFNKGNMPDQSGLDLLRQQLKTNQSGMSNYKFSDSEMNQLRGASRFNSNVNNSFNMVLGAPDLNTDLNLGNSTGKDGDFVVKMSDNHSFHFLTKDDYIKNRFGTQNESQRTDDSRMRDEDHVKGMSMLQKVSSREDYATNQSNYKTLKNKFESNNIYNSNYADPEFRGKDEDGPEDMNCGPELKDMEIEYPELNTKGYHLTDSSINMGNPTQFNQESSIMENSNVIGGRRIDENGNGKSYNMGVKGLLSNNTSLNDQQKTIVNRFGLNQFNKGKAVVTADMTQTTTTYKNSNGEIPNSRQVRTDNSIKFQGNAKSKYPSMELDMTPIQFEKKRNSGGISGTLPSVGSIRTHDSGRDKEIAIKFKQIKREYNFYQHKLDSLKAKINNQGRESLETWEMLTSEYERMYTKYEGLANQLIKRLSNVNSRLKVEEEKYRIIETEFRQQTDEFIETQENLDTFQEEFLEMYDAFRIYMFSKEGIDVGNDLCNIKNQLRALKEYFVLKLSKYTIKEKGGSKTHLEPEPASTGRASNHSLNSLKKRSMIGTKKEEISYNLSTSMNSQFNNPSKNRQDSKIMDNTYSNINNLMSNYKVIRKNYSHNRHHDSHNISVLDKILNCNLLDQGEHDTPHGNDFDVTNSMTLGLNDTQNQIKGLSRIKSNDSNQFKGILSYNFQINPEGAGMNPQGMSGLGFSKINCLPENPPNDGHDSAIRSVHDRIEEMTNANKDSQLGDQMTLEESIVRSKNISNLEELSEINKRKSERIIRENNDSTFPKRSVSQFGPRKKKLDDNSDFKVKISEQSMNFNFGSKLDKGKESDTDGKRTGENSGKQGLDTIGNSFDPNVFQSKLSEMPETNRNPLNDMSLVMQDVIRRTTNEKTQEPENNPLNITKGIDDILGLQGAESRPESQQDSRKNVNMADESYNVLIGFEGHDFDYSSKVDDTPQRNPSENSFNVNLDEKKSEEEKPESNDDHQDMDVNMDMDFSMDFEEAKPNIETPSEQGQSNRVIEDKNSEKENQTIEDEEDIVIEKKSETEDTKNDRTLVGKSSLDETPRPSDAFTESRNTDSIPQVKIDEPDDITLSRTENDPNSRPVLMTEEEIKDEDGVQSAPSMKSINLESESQRELMSTIVEYMTNDNPNRESQAYNSKTDPERENTLNLDTQELIGHIDEIDETNLSNTSFAEDASETEAMESDFVTPLETPSERTIDENENRDIIFLRNNSEAGVSTKTDKLDDASTVAGTVVSESMQKKSQSEKQFKSLKNKIGDNKNKFKKKKSVYSSKKNEKNKFSRNKSKNSKKVPTERGRKKSISSKDMKHRVKNNLYHNSKSKEQVKLTHRNGLCPKTRQVQVEQPPAPFSSKRRPQDQVKIQKQKQKGRHPIKIQKKTLHQKKEHEVPKQKQTGFDSAEAQDAQKWKK